MTITIETVTGPRDDARALVGELERELASHYAPEQRHGLAFEAIFQPNIRFFVASRDNLPVGCGGIALLDGFAEIKRMYVRTAIRGQGVAEALIARMTQEVAAEGLALLRLETGIHQTAALRFYAKCGFAPCDAFAPYTAMPPHSIATSVFMEKRLTG